MRRKTMIMLALLVLVGTLLIAGCTTTGNAGYDYRQQQAPVGGGCGVQAPASEDVSEVAQLEAALEKSVF